MGLLDDAIKEHLELKRKRGADADEVARLEQEALGPPQRGEFAGAPAAAEAADVPDDDAVAAVQAEPAPDTAEHAVSEPAPEPPPEAPEPPPEAEPGPEPEPRDQLDESWLDDEPGPPVEPLEPAPDQHTVEYTPPADPPPEGEDVLEETPDFLQETPEHDRLWFEQKPPRDFDLDR
jgi:hypothetical protein